MDTSNWVGACHKCNSRRGAEYLAKKRAASVQARQKAISAQNRNSEKNQKNDQNFFDLKKEMPDRKSVV
jgi:hypothetical protein